jgi:uncharacterized protein (DUF697 family)
MARNDVADVVNQLVGAGMDLSKALEYAPVAAKFVVGQGSSGVDTAKMINALGQNAKITDPKQMQQALEAIAYQGQAGSFEASDMAKWFPELLANMAAQGITGLDAVTQLGAMLQVQMKQAGSSDEAANNLKNWMGKIGSTDTVKAYEKAGIDYKGSMQTGLQNGLSTLETSMGLAQKYIQATDPKRAAAMAEATSKISKEADPEKAKAMMASLEESLRTGDLFADMQVKAALSAYMQNKALYSQLKNDSREATGILDKNLAERRESSSQKWAEMAQSMDDAMRSVGDALRPVTDTVAETLTKLTKGITSLTDSAPGVVAGIATVGAGLVALKGIVSTIKISKGLLNIARGSRGGRSGSEARNKNPGELDLVATGLDVVSRVKEAATGGGLGAEGDAGNDGVRKVFVVNAGAMGGGVDASGESRRRGRGARRSARRRSLPSSRGPRLSAPRPPVPAPRAPVPVSRPPAPAPRAPVPVSRPPVPAPRAPVQVSRPPAPAPRPPVPVSKPPVPALGSPVPASRPPVPAPRPPVPIPLPSVPSVPNGALSKLGVVANAVGKVGKVGKIIPGGTLLESGAMAFETFQNAKTKDEKAEGYGEAAGNLAGTMAGAAAGAAIGSVVPIIGTAIGGMIGAYLGSQGGAALGGSLGKSLFGGEDEKPEEKPKAPVATTPLMMASAAQQGPVLGDAARSMAVTAPLKSAAQAIQPKEPEKPVPAKVDQQFQYSLSMPVTVQGDVKDPQRLAQDLMPHMQRMMEGAAKQNAAKLYDEPHV